MNLNNIGAGLGSIPLLAFLDATGEPLAGILRPGNAGRPRKRRCAAS